MAVLGQAPSEVHLNSSTPSAPSGAGAVEFQAGSPYPDPNNASLSVRDVSAYVAQAVAATGSPLSTPTPGVILYDASGSALKYLGADGNWHSCALSLAKVSHKFLDSYDDTTGDFTQSQPAASDLSDTATAGNVLRGNGSAFVSAQLAEADLGFTDITTNNVSTSKHGLVPKLPGSATEYLDGTGAFSIPAGGGGGGGGGTANLHSLQVSTLGAVHQYKLNETSGTTATDAGSSASNGTYNGSLGSTYYLGQPSISADLSAACYFNSGGFCNLNFHDPPASGVGAWTIEFVVMMSPTCANGKRVLANDQPDSTGNGIEIIWQQNAQYQSIGCTVGFTGGTVAVQPIMPMMIGGVVYLVQFVYSGTTLNTLSIYVNGRLVATAATSGTYKTAGYNMTVGYDPKYAGDPIIGAVSNVAFYNFALTAAEIITNALGVVNGASLLTAV